MNWISNFGGQFNIVEIICRIASVVEWLVVCFVKKGAPISLGAKLSKLPIYQLENLIHSRLKNLPIIDQAKFRRSLIPNNKYRRSNSDAKQGSKNNYRGEYLAYLQFQALGLEFSCCCSGIQLLYQHVHNWKMMGHKDTR